MDETNLCDKNICFSSARNMFENSSNKPRQTKQADHVKNFNKNTSDVVSMITLEKQERINKRDGNINNSNDSLVVSVGDKKTEISFLKTNINMKSNNELHNLSKVSTGDKDLGNEQNMDASKREPKKIVRSVEAIETNSNDLIKFPTNNKTFSKLTPKDHRQLLLNEIKAGKTLNSFSKQKGKKIQEAIEPWLTSGSINRTDQLPGENRFISKVSYKSPTSPNYQDLIPLRVADVRQNRNDQLNSMVSNNFKIKIPQPVSPTSIIDFDETEQLEDDKIAERTILINWDPSKVMKSLYRIEIPAKDIIGYQFLDKSGYLESLPISKTKETFLKTWKRQFFRAQGGKISFYQESKEENESGRLEMDGGKVDIIGPRMLGIKDGGGRYLVVRCPNEVETESWRNSIQSQINGDVSVRWIQPMVPGNMLQHNRVVVIEIGSCSVRAGILNSSPTLPNIFFPNIVATNPTRGKFFGFDALKPDIRSTSIVSFPVKPSNKVDKYALDWESISGLFSYVFQQLKLEPSQCSIMFVSPTNFSHQVRGKFLEIFFERLKLRSASVFSQTLLALYSYKVDTGIVVNAGETIEILPVVDGFVVEGSISRLPFGGQRVSEIFNSFLADRKYRFSTDIEFQLIRYAIEKLCYVSLDFKSDFNECLRNSEAYRKVLPLDLFDLPFEAEEPISCDLACFKSTEGFFDMSAWGVDSPPLQRLIQNVISYCPIDSRRQMWRNIYLSGGITLLPNFKERLEAELNKVTAPNVVVQVHASRYRYHASYLGACALATMEAFQRSCVTIDEWILSSSEYFHFLESNIKH